MTSLTHAFKQIGITNFSEALSWMHRIPYGRNSDRTNYKLILTENRGTCSTKHALLAAFAKELRIDADLKMAICRLDRKLEPKASSFLDTLGVEFFPEAHCYLHFDGKDIDVTFPEKKPLLQAKVLKTYTIQPDQIGNFKEKLHLEYLSNWSKFPLEKLWSLREEYIQSLGKK